jgi:uncharacterized repeat protein (TIGR01451 family)
MKKVNFLVIALLSGSLSLLESSSDALSISTKLLQEVSLGSNQLKSLTAAIPDTVVVYEHTISNNTNTLATDLVFTDTIPQHTTYVAGSAKGDGCIIEYSLNGDVYDESFELFIYRDSHLNIAKSKSYKYIRWTCKELKAHSKQILLFKTKIN